MALTKKGPILIPGDYDDCVDRMKDYLYALQDDVWRSVINGPHTACCILIWWWSLRKESSHIYWQKDDWEWSQGEERNVV